MKGHRSSESPRLVPQGKKSLASLWDGWTKAGNTQDATHAIVIAYAGTLGKLAALPGPGEAERAWKWMLTLHGQPGGLGELFTFSTPQFPLSNYQKFSSVFNAS